MGISGKLLIKRPAAPPKASDPNLQNSNTKTQKSENNKQAQEGKQENTKAPTSSKHRAPGKEDLGTCITEECYTSKNCSSAWFLQGSRIITHIPDP